MPSGAGVADVPGNTPYTVKSGDTLYSIALEYGLDWRDIARANNMGVPYTLVIGQRLVLPGSGGTVANGPAGGTTDPDSGVVVQPIPEVAIARPVLPADQPAEQAPAVPEQAPADALPARSVQGFIWPHDGQVIQGYKAGSNKGMDFAANVGDPVKASMGGKVVYSGNHLRGYGNLVIIKHDNNLLTAYAHNKTLLVKEGDVVKTGQKIAEAGQSDTDRPMLHFEVRERGKPVDPLGYLPKR
ncbi:MAG: peptidoglycan DD-metalloendopeptidase family protein [Limnobacter sp.]|nr:peptidoglycan DD-metalloendopeptidase family protein [Limnobacter sp.]